MSLQGPFLAVNRAPASLCSCFYLVFGVAKSLILND
jgi:hypothetical protein